MSPIERLGFNFCPVMLATKVCILFSNMSKIHWLSIELDASVCMKTNRVSKRYQVAMCKVALDGKND